MLKDGNPGNRRTEVCVHTPGPRPSIRTYSSVCQEFVMFTKLPWTAANIGLHTGTCYILHHSAARSEMFVGKIIWAARTMVNFAALYSAVHEVPPSMGFRKSNVSD